jgi:hypothetical protein
MPETTIRFAAHVCVGPDDTPLPEYGVSSTQDPETQTWTVTSWIQPVPDARLTISVKSRNKQAERMGVHYEVDGDEKNRVGLRPGFGFFMRGKPVGVGSEEPVLFNGIKQIKLSLSRSIASDEKADPIVYPSKEGAPVVEGVTASTAVKTVYPDKHPVIVFIFNCDPNAPIAGPEALKAIPVDAPGILYKPSTPAVKRSAEEDQAPGAPKKSRTSLADIFGLEPRVLFPPRSRQSELLRALGNLLSTLADATD